MLRGCLAAALTPLRDDGARVDEAAFDSYVSYLASGGVDGILALGTTGEGMLLSTAERRLVLERFVAAARGLGDPHRGRFAVAAHCGAFSTRETCELAAHAAAAGADAVAVIGPPFFSFDEDALLRHFVAAAAASRELPFYAYEFAARTGYGLSPEFLDRLRDAAPNLRGLKASNPAFADVAPFLNRGLDVFVGAEGLVFRALSAGAAGAVSGLAAVFPKAVSDHVRAPDAEGSAGVAALRARLNALPFHAASKEIVRSKGVAMRPDVRAPLRGLTADESVRARELVSAAE